ncbi:hypothetical protein L1887_14283 [Cichorium endivia]|nr:hypothetical protein L1887_14283 [Cichorium endivia]
MKLKLRKPKIDEIRIAYVVLIRRGVGRYLNCIPGLLNQPVLQNNIRLFGQRDQSVCQESNENIKLCLTLKLINICHELHCRCRLQCYSFVLTDWSLDFMLDRLSSQSLSIFLSSLAARFSRFLLLDHTKINNLSGGRSSGRASMADQKGGPIAGEGYAVTGN